MFLTQKHNRNIKNTIIYLTLLLLVITFYSFANNNNEFISLEAAKGDTLWSISKQYRIPLNLILDLNGIKETDSLSIGQIIKIPQDDLSPADNNMHTVKKGETLWSIAKEYNLSVDRILSTNNFDNSEIISIGQQIEIPSSKSTAPETNVITRVVIDKKNNNTNNSIIQPEGAESIWSIAQKHQPTDSPITLASNTENSEIISIGQKIEIPSSKSTAPEKNNIIQPVIDKKNNNTNNSIIQPKKTESLIYTVKAGDSLWNISQKYGVSVEVIINVNNLKDKDSLLLGQKLKIPAAGGVSGSNTKQKPIVINYMVVKGDTLWNISQKYEISMSTIISTNNLQEISQLSIGQKLKLPITNMDIAKANGYGQETVKEEIIYSVKKGESLWNISREYNVKLEAIIAANSITDASKISAGQQLRIPNVPGTGSNIYNFIWPVRRRITSPYGVRVISGRKEFHSGIDIGGTTGDNIVAVENGKVSYSGYMRGYGNVIILSHSGGYSTVYAHNSVNLVKNGQNVKKGTIIAKIGRTGNATGSHLHFEVRLNGKPVNPLSYLN